jgi:hypothetical protein
MFRRIIEIARDADALVPLMLGIAVSVLAISDVTTPRIVDNSILIVLAVLSFALLRDRWIEDSATKGKHSPGQLGVMVVRVAFALR